MDLKTFINPKYNELKKEQNIYIKAYNSSKSKSNKHKYYLKIQIIEEKLKTK